MAVNRRAAPILAIFFVVLILLTTTFYLYAFIDSIYPLRFCGGYWAFFVLSLITFVLFPNTLYLIAAIRYWKKPRGEKVATVATVKSTYSTDKIVKRVLLAVFLVIVFILSSMTLALLILVAFFRANHITVTTGEFVVSGFISRTPGDITRDVEGVPHLTAVELDDVAFLQGFTHAQDRLFQLDYYRRMAKGNLATLLPSNDAYQSDVVAKTIGFANAARKIMNSTRLSNDTITWLNAYSNGVNAYLNSQPPYPFEFRYYKYWMDEPWTPVDSLAILKLWQWSVSGNYDKELSRFRLLTDRAIPVSRVKQLEPMTHMNSTATFTAQDLGVSILTIPSNIAREAASLAAEETYLTNLQTQLGATPGSVTETSTDIDNMPVDAESIYAMMSNSWDATAKTFGTLHRSLSNGFIIHQRGTTSGTSAIVAGAMGGKNTIPCLFYPMHLRFTPTRDEVTGVERPSAEAYGATIPGIPGIISGRTVFFTWQLSPSNIDTMDIYIMKEAQPGVSYTYLNVTKNYNQRTETVYNPNTRATETLNILESPEYGVVLNGNILKNTYKNQVLSLRWAGFNHDDSDPDLTIDWMHKIWRVTTNLEFVDLTTNLYHSPAANILYADRDDIKYFIVGGKIPLRRFGHSGTFPMEGNGQYDWQGFVPTVANTRLNSKDIIFTAQNRIVGQGYDVPFGYDYDADVRAQYIFSKLNDIINGGRTINSRNVMDLLSDTTDSLFLVFKPLFDRIPTSVLDSRGQELLNALKNWDGVANLGSAALGWRGFYWELSKLPIQETKVRYWDNPQYLINVFVEPTNVTASTNSINDPACSRLVTSPTGNACLTFAAQALNRAAARYGVQGWSHGTPFRHLLLRDDDMFSCACSRYFAHGGTPHSVNAQPEFSPNNNFEAVHGPNYRMVSSFDENIFQNMIPMAMSGYQWEKERYDWFLDRWRNNQMFTMDMARYTQAATSKLLIFRRN